MSITKPIVFISALLITSLSIAQFPKKLKKNLPPLSKNESPLSQDIIGKGLKEALTKGVEKGVEKISKPDGFFKNEEKPFKINQYL